MAHVRRTTTCHPELREPIFPFKRTKKHCVNDFWTGGKTSQLAGFQLSVGLGVSINPIQLTWGPTRTRASWDEGTKFGNSASSDTSSRDNSANSLASVARSVTTPATTRAHKWRVRVKDEALAGWQINEVSFITDEGERLQVGSSGCSALASSNAAAAAGALTGSGSWSSTQSNETHYLGIQCTYTKSIAEVKLNQGQLSFGKVFIEFGEDDSWFFLRHVPAFETNNLETIWLRGILHWVTSCDQCQQSLCTGLMQDNELVNDDHDQGAALSDVGCDVLPASPKKVRNSKTGRIYVVAPRLQGGGG